MTSQHDAPLPEVPGYELIRRLGRGGMGVVYEARQLHLDRPVAVKVLKGQRSHPLDVTRFEREARAVARLDHPNIVRVFDSGQVGDLHFIAMELVPGVDLDTLVQRHGAIPIAQACGLVRQACLGLQHAFEREMVHRDIKPANLLVTVPDAAADWWAKLDRQALLERLAGGFTLKIIDMGLALMVAGQDRPPTITRDGLVVGTAGFAAPEQLEDSHRVDIRADLYSLGCVLYYLLSGWGPFPGDSVSDIIEARFTMTPSDIRVLRPETPPLLAETINVLLDRRPEQRYQTPAELEAALAAAEASLAAEPALPVPVASTTNEVYRLEGHDDAVLSGCLVADGSLAFSGGKDRSARLWETSTGRERRRWLTLGAVNRVAATRDGRLGVTGTSTGIIQVWDLESAKEQQRFRSGGGEITCLALADDAGQLIWGAKTGSLELASIGERRAARRLVGHQGVINAVAFVPGGLILSAGQDHSLRLWDQATLKETRRHNFRPGVVKCLGLAPDGTRAFLAATGGLILVWDVENWRELHRFATADIAACIVAVDATTILTGHGDHTVRRWRVDDGTETSCFKGHAGPITAVDLRREAGIALSASRDRTLRLWRLPA